MKYSARNLLFLSATFLLLISLFLIGCVSQNIIPNQDTMSSIKAIEVVAIEPPPLTITAESMQYLSEFTPSVYDIGSKHLMVISGIVFLINYPKITNELLPIASKYQNILSAKDTWIPTVELGKYAANILLKNGMRKVELKPGYEMLSGVTNSAPTVFMENWYAPIRSWYNADSSITPYNKSTENAPDAYLEIGICNYELMNDKLLLQVMVKLIDSNTNIVIGKTRNYELVKLGNGKNLLLDEGKKFKDIFYSTGLRLIDKSFKELKL